MQQLQSDGSYNELLPKADAWTKDETLSAQVASILGLRNNYKPDNAFLGLYFGAGTYRYRVRVLFDDGRPCSGCTVSGLTQITGQSLVTDKNGYVLGKSTSTSVTIGVTIPYLDWKTPDRQSIVSTGIVTDVVFTLEKVTNMLTVLSSTTSKISSYVKSFDVTIVGGGGSGGGGHWFNSDEIGSSYSAPVGTGGSGGFVTTSTNIVLKNRDGTFNYSIGSGGTKATDYTIDTKTGHDGGITSFTYGDLTLTAQGGVGGSTYYYSVYKPQKYSGPTGNGNGGSTEARSGSNGKGYIFNDSSLGLAGGRGGGRRKNDSLTSKAYSQGGNPGGGKGSASKVAPTSGTIGGGGRGCGGGGDGRYTPGSGAGGNGIVYIRFKI